MRSFRYRLTGVANYLVLAFSSAALIRGIWARSQTAFWMDDAMVRVRWNYDLLGATLAVLALPLAVGFLYRTRWALDGSIGFAVNVAFLMLGIPLLAVGLVYVQYGTFDASLLPLTRRVEEGMLGILAVLDVFLLSRARFRREYLGGRPAPASAVAARTDDVASSPR